MIFTPLLGQIRCVERRSVLSEDVTVSKTFGDSWFRKTLFLSTFWCKLECPPMGTWIHQKQLRPTPSLQLVIYVANGYDYLQANLLHRVHTVCHFHCEDLLDGLDENMVDGALHLHHHHFATVMSFLLRRCWKYCLDCFLYAVNF